MTRVLIDTDVILDFFFDREPFSNHAAKILSLCETKEIEGYITAVIISNVYYLLRQSAPHDKVLSKIEQLITILNVLTIDKSTIQQAIKSNFKDFEDALQHFSAVSSEQITLILTRNIKDYKNSQLAVMTPENYLNSKI